MEVWNLLRLGYPSSRKIIKPGNNLFPCLYPYGKSSFYNLQSARHIYRISPSLDIISFAVLPIRAAYTLNLFEKGGDTSVVYHRLMCFIQCIFFFQHVLSDYMPAGYIACCIADYFSFFSTCSSLSSIALIMIFNAFILAYFLSFDSNICQGAKLVFVFSSISSTATS